MFNCCTCSLEMVHIPIWLLVAGVLVLAVPLVYYIYDAFCKPEDVNQGRFMMIGMMMDPYYSNDDDDLDEDGRYHDDHGGDGDIAGCKRVSQTLVIIFLLAGLAWAVVGFLWIFGVSRAMRMISICPFGQALSKVGTPINNALMHCTMTQAS